MKTNRKVLYSIFLILLVILATVSSFFLYYFFKMRNENLSFNKIEVQESSTVSYNILANDSKFYDSSVSNKSYIVDEINNIKTYFNYLITFSNDVAINYSYIIEGKIVGNTKGTEDKVLEKTMHNNAPIVKTYTGKIINISDTFDINVPEYLQVLREFNSTYGIETDAYIQYDITITYAYTSDTINKSKTEKKELTVVVPLSETTTIPKLPASNIDTHSEYSDMTSKDKQTYMAICFELFGSTLLFVLTAILVARRLFRTNTIYKEDLKTLLKQYKKYIVKIKNIPDFINTDVLFVDDFKDLLDICEVTEKPINYVEIVKNEVSVFVIFSDFKAYVYKVYIRNEE